MATDNPPNATVYVKNLEERIKIPALIEGLREVFGEFGTIVDIVAKKNLRAKGQAFVVYDNVNSAQEAIDTLDGFELFDKEMKLAFAKSRSDATVKANADEEEFEKHKKSRLAEKDRKQAQRANEEKNMKRPAEEPEINNRAIKPAKTGVNKGAAGLVPEEYVPPSKVLFLRNVSADYGQEALSAVFGRYPGFKEVRVVPTMAGIAFVEYETEDGAIAAKSEMQNRMLGDQKVQVTYQRQ